MEFRSVSVTYLEMTHPSQLRPKRLDRDDLSINLVGRPLPEFSRFLYAAVGGDWFWIDRLGWSYQDWLAWLAQPDLETWVAYVNGTPAGFFELNPRNGMVEIAYFGLIPSFIGIGLGGHLLTVAVERAWQRQPERVRLNTCTLDHPNALANYQARGFQILREEQEIRHLPPQSPGPWPGAHPKR